MRKGEIAFNKQFPPFLTMFSTLHGTYFSFQMHFKMSSVTCFDLDQSKILSYDNGLTTSFSFFLKILLKVFFPKRQWNSIFLLEKVEHNKFRRVKRNMDLPGLTISKNKASY